MPCVTKISTCACKKDQQQSSIVQKITEFLIVWLLGWLKAQCIVLIVAWSICCFVSGFFAVY